MTACCEACGQPLPSLLDPVEERVLRLVAQGYSYQQIAERLAYAPHYVKNVMYRTMRKLGVHDRYQAVVAAEERGLITVLIGAA